MLKTDISKSFMLMDGSHFFWYNMSYNVHKIYGKVYMQYQGSVIEISLSTFLESFSAKSEMVELDT